MKLLHRSAMLLVGLGLLTPTVLAQEGFQRDFNTPPNVPNVPGAPQSTQIVISGATLVRPLFENRPGLTNDFIDVDGDGIFGFDPLGSPQFVDQLATEIGSFNAAGVPTFNYTPGPNGFSNNNQWITNYRGVGSVNGYADFINFHEQGILPSSVPGERGYINRVQYAANGGITSGGVLGAGVARDATGTPLGVSIQSVDIAVLDVPSAWATRNGSAANAAWNRRPNQNGYGQGAPTSNQAPSAQLPALTTLNTNTAAPDANTIYDTDIAFVPVATLLNRGVGQDDNNDGVIDGNMRATTLQHLYVTGRTETGENLVAAGRSAGSGTRNAYMNSLGIDPAWGNGDNVGTEFAVRQVAALGTGDVGQTSDGTFASNVAYQANQAEASSGAEFAAQNHRLGVSYTGIAGRSDDWQLGRWEVANIRKDIDGNGDGNQDNTSTNASAYVRPTIVNVIDPNGNNASFAYIARQNGVNVNKGAAGQSAENPDGVMYEIAGPASWVTLGDPESGRNGNTNPAMSNLAARDFIRNLTDATAAFVGIPGGSNTLFSPGETLAQLFILPQGQDKNQSKANPTEFLTNASLNTNLQSVLLSNVNWDSGSGVSIGAYGTSDTGRDAGLVPFRKGSAAGVAYSDGTTTVTSATNASSYISGNRYVTIDGTFLIYGTALNARNEVAYDFNNDERRNVNDVENMMKWAAIRNLNGFAGPAVTAPEAGTGLSLEIIADGNGDGNFNAEDIRYFADGLAMTVGSVKANPDADSTRRLDRRLGFTLVDQNWSTLTAGADNNFFNTTLATGKTYVAGDSRADIAGSVSITKGANPIGHDGTVNAIDIDYIYAQFIGNAVVTDGAANWSNLDEAVGFDLSGDMTGDLIVDQADVDEIVEVVLGTFYGDANLDGQVDGFDFDILAQAFSTQVSSWSFGDFTGDGTVDGFDFDLLAQNFGLGTGSSLVGLAATAQFISENAEYSEFASLVPEPSAALTLLGLGGLTLRRRSNRG